MDTSISMIMLGVSDIQRSVAFYRDIVSFALVRQFGELAFFQAGPIQLALHEGLPRATGGAIAGAVEVILAAPSVVERHEALTARGVTFFAAPREVSPGQWAASFRDPDGHILTLFGPE